MSTTVDLESLHFKGAFCKALGTISATQFWRLSKAGVIPDPDCYVGSRPAWTGKTINAVIDRMRVAKPPEKAMPRSPGRHGKKTTDSSTLV